MFFLVVFAYGLPIAILQLAPQLQKNCDYIQERNGNKEASPTCPDGFQCLIIFILLLNLNSLAAESFLSGFQGTR